MDIHTWKIRDKYDREGKVLYCPDLQDVVVDFPDEAQRIKVVAYLLLERQFRRPIEPAPGNITGWFDETHEPVVSYRFMKWAMNEMYGRIGIWAE